MRIENHDGAYMTFQEENLGDLLGKECLLVEPGTAEGTVKLLATPGNEIGVLHEKSDTQSKNVTVRLLGKGGTVRIKAGGIIAKGARVVGEAGGTIAAAADGETIARKLTQGNSAAGDIVEVLDVMGYVAPEA